MPCCLSCCCKYSYCTDHHIALAGASGGCYALIGAHLASVVVVSMAVIKDYL